jgi:methyltransferase (TIGR00027 family)
VSGTSQPRHSSRTALSVAALRAAHQLVDLEPRILDDRVASRLLGGDDHPLIQSSIARARNPAAMALRTLVLLRSRFAEERMAEAAARGVDQFVMLGAGFDTFAYRQPAWAADARIFEVDHLATQSEKRRRLEAAGIAAPANLHFVDIDFERVSLRAGLEASALDFARPAFFSCLGVLVYLTPDAAHEIFALVASFPPGSEIVFTFGAPGSMTSDLALRAGAAGEPWRSEFEPGALEQTLKGLGFSRVGFLDCEQANRRYFAGRTDGLRAPARTSIGWAQVG